MAEASECAVLVDCNLFRQKSHTNPISRLLEPIANAIEHGRAARVDVAMERAEASGELCFHVTEHDGAGMTPEECEEAIRFGLHAAKKDATSLHNYSHNGIGTKACLNIFSRLAIFSIRRDKQARTYVLLLLDVADTLGNGKCKPATRFVWKDNAQGVPDWGGPHDPQAEIIREICAMLTFLPPPARSVQGLAAEFARIGGRQGTRMVYFGTEGREGTSEAKRQFILDGTDVRVHPLAFVSGAAVAGGAKDNNCPLYVTSLRQRLRHFLAEPKTALYLNGQLVEPGGATALFECLDEKIQPAVDELGVLGVPQAVIDPSKILIECGGFRGVVRMGRSDKNRAHRRWGTELLGDHFGTTQNGGLVVYVNGALVPLGEDTLWKHGIASAGKKIRWLKADGGSKWGKHVFGVVEMCPPADETILDMGKERLMPAEGGLGTQEFLRRLGPIIDFVLGVAYFRDPLPTVQKNLSKGTDKLLGGEVRPVVTEDAEDWMDKNMVAACKKCVRMEKATQAAVDKAAVAACEACHSKAGVHTCPARRGQDEAQAQNDDDERAGGASSSTGRRRQAPTKLEPKMWRGTASSHGSSSSAAAASKARKTKETALRVERRLRERSRQLLLAELWKRVERPGEGSCLVGWAVEATEVAAEDREQLCAGQIVSFNEPDRYVVQWDDRSESEYGYSDLFSPGQLPMVVPVPPEQGSATGPQRKRRRTTNQPAAAAAASRPAASSTPPAASPATSTSYSVGDTVSVLFEVAVPVRGGGEKTQLKWYEGRIQKRFRRPKEQVYSVSFEGDEDDYMVDTNFQQMKGTTTTSPQAPGAGLPAVHDDGGGAPAAPAPAVPAAAASAPPAAAAAATEFGQLPVSGSDHTSSSGESASEQSRQAVAEAAERGAVTVGLKNDFRVVLKEVRLRVESVSKILGFSNSTLTNWLSGQVRDVDGRIAQRVQVWMSQAQVPEASEQSAQARNPASALGDGFQAPRTERTTLDAQVVGRADPKVNRRKSGPERWEGQNEAAPVKRVRHDSGLDVRPAAAAPATMRTAWSSEENAKLQELHDTQISTGLLGWTQVADTLNTIFHEGRPIRVKWATQSAFMRLQKRQAKSSANSAAAAVPAAAASTGTAATTAAMAVVEAPKFEAEWEVEKVVAKRWKLREGANRGASGGGLPPMFPLPRYSTCAAVGSTGEYQIKWRGYDGPSYLSWEPAEGLMLCEPAIAYEREHAELPDLSNGLEREKVRCLCFGSPLPPATFDYIFASERVGQAKAQWQRPEAADSLLPLSTQQIEILQHSLDARGRAYDDAGGLRFARTVIYETPVSVRKSDPAGGQHFNRVVTNGRKPEGLEVIHTGAGEEGGRGFGVWCREVIEKGAFVSTYAGEILSIADADAREDKSYQFVLQIQGKVLPSTDLRAMQPLWPAAEFVIDARRQGNVARFFNHDGDQPNLFTQMVFCEGHMDARMPVVAFFAAERIDAYTELRFDYGPASEFARPK